MTKNSKHNVFKNIANKDITCLHIFFIKDSMDSYIKSMTFRGHESIQLN
jgi:hypothetical protein